MLSGRFGDTSGRPYIEGRVLIPRLGLWADLSFVVDTGADMTLLMPSDAIALGVDFRSLVGSQFIVGIGGTTHSYAERAVLVFADRRLLYVYDISVHFVAPSHQLADVPSLVGRDIIDRWRMTYEPSRQVLRFEVRSADVIAPIDSMYHRIAPSVQRD